MSSNKQALVIGSSMAGLMAARILSDHFTQVTVIERDQLPQGAEYRHGVPQAHHAHLLLARGREVMQSFFPTMAADLRAMGVPELDMTADGVFLTAGGWGQRFRSGIISNSVSRVTLEWYVRSQLQKRHNITFMEQTDVKGLVASEDRATITGVEVESRVDHGSQTLIADLVVDASGRNSRALAWLSALGYDAPPETVVNSHLGYATRWYQMSSDREYDWQFLVIGARPQENNPRAAAALVVENDQMVVTLAGINKVYPPTDEEGFLEFARQLATPALYEAINGLEAISPIYGYRRTENRWHHYEKLTRHPQRFLVMGDAYCGFNPIYGQGMTVAAQEAQALDGLLKLHELDDLPAVFYRALAETVKTPWLLATGEDLRYPLTEGDRPGPLARAVQKYSDQIIKIAPHDSIVGETFTRVTNLTVPPTALFQPGIMLRVLWHSLFSGARDTSHNAPVKRVKEATGD